MSYYNTTKQTPPESLAYRKIAQTQDGAILKFFERHPRQHITPSEVRQWVYHNTVPITSVRRSMNTLTNDGKLVKTEKQKTGPYGRPEHCWKLATGQMELVL